MLLSREEFKRQVFNRDEHLCVVCEQAAVDAHHITERKLFPDGGYYLNNGVSLCSKCHKKAESTEFSCVYLRDLAKISIVILPPHLYSDVEYDKWGNPIIAPNSRLKGELFFEDGVLKALKDVLWMFTDRVKYPRTYHLPWSPGRTKDDRVIESADMFSGKDVVVTVKMDGENTSMYRGGIHARSIDYSPHSSRDRIKALHASISHEIPVGWRICGENLFAKHSIHYKNLDDFFLVFSMWDEHNKCLSWNDTKLFAEVLGLKVVPVLYSGLYDEEIIKGLETPSFNGDECEGYVVRVSDGFTYKDFRHMASKFVRKDHVQTHGHWIRNKVVKNEWKN